MARLLDWYIDKMDDRYVIWGDVYDSTKFGDGQEIHTSRIVKIERTDDSFEIQTQNTLYHCPWSAMRIRSCTWLWKCLKPCLEKCGHKEHEAKWLTERLYDTFFELGEEKKKYLQELLLQKEKNCILLEFSAEESYYFRLWAKRQRKGEGKRIKFGEEDSLHILVKPEHLLAEIQDREKEKVLFRFYPYEKDRLKICGWEENYGGVYIRNGGMRTLTIETEKNSYVLEPADCCRIE